MFAGKHPDWLCLAGLVALLVACAQPAPSGESTTPCPSEAYLLIPEGWFSMGEDDGRSSNQPQHQIYLEAFCLQKQEVTRWEFARFVAATGYEDEWWKTISAARQDKLPVTGALWEEAQAYCHWAGTRLPTEAEWEKAARGTDGRRYPWGDEWDGSKANTAESGSGGVLPVGSYPQGASPYGLLDMAGNAAEWVADYYEADYYRSSPDRNPTGPTQVLDHGLRGGSYDSPPDWATTYFRDSSHSARSNPRAGFRCACSPVFAQAP
ncbi:MAG TPA: SUMF1/EgtB/PvdO family nonheme iron enzyme [Anaerolineales bacterium]|nr:SUMF1/EgtB/PvdO family nonheme iron enzyme [Anaerolineales bacterium]